MRGAVLDGPRDVRFEEREVPKIINPTDAVIRISSACVCGSDKIFDLNLPRDQVAEGCRSMDERRAIIVSHYCVHDGNEVQLWNHN
jgi:threonine dehydrogenase-like Zn-dependent dehydrogenase